MGYTIYSGKYETGTVEQKRGFIELFGEEDIEHKFDLYFHWFNRVHEIGHCILDAKNINMDKVKEELFVNRFAVAYWKEVDNNNLEKIKKPIDDILSKIPTNRFIC